MAHSFEDYGAMLSRLLPRGLLWTAAEGGTLRRFLTACGMELARIEGDAERLLSELDPATTVEAIADWEKEVGLPDECLSADLSLAARREAVRQKLQRGGLMNVAALRELVQALGYERVDILEVQPFRASLSHAEEPVWEEEAAHLFYVSAASGTKTRRFHAGSSMAGHYLSYARDPVLECIISREKPAHTKALFQYHD